MAASSNPNGLRVVLPNAGGGFAVQGSEIFAGTIAEDNLGANIITSASVSKNLIQTVTVSLNAAAIKTLYSAPSVIIAAPGAGLTIVVLDAVAVFTYGSSQFTSGGAVQLQYDSTTHAGGTTPLTTVAAAVIQAAANSVTQMQSAAGTTLTSNKGIYASAATADFATATTGLLAFNVTYRIIAA